MYICNISTFNQGFYGTNCELIRGALCVSTDSCEGHYSCNSLGMKVCHTNWTSQNCDIHVGEYAQNDCPTLGPCRNNGTCFKGACCCLPGFGNKLCAVEVDQGASSSLGR